MNQYLHVEFDPRDRGVWKLSVPQGQRFSKHFLAGVEVWARQALQQVRGGKGAGNRDTRASGSEWERLAAVHLMCGFSL